MFTIELSLMRPQRCAFLAHLVFADCILFEYRSLRATSDGQLAQLLQRPYTIYVYEILEVGRWLGQERNAASSSQDVSRTDLVLCHLSAKRDLHCFQHRITLKDTLD